MKEPISHDMYWQACHNWNCYWNQERGNLKYPFYRFLGHSITQTFHKTDNDPAYVTPEAARKIRLLAGPHHYAALKAYEARKQDETQS